MRDGVLHPDDLGPDEKRRSSAASSPTCCTRTVTPRSASSRRSRAAAWRRARRRGTLPRCTARSGRSRSRRAARRTRMDRRDAPAPTGLRHPPVPRHARHAARTAGRRRPRRRSVRVTGPIGVADGLARKPRRGSGRQCRHRSKCSECSSIASTRARSMPPVGRARIRLVVPEDVQADVVVAGGGVELVAGGCDPCTRRHAHRPARDLGTDGGGSAQRPRRAPRRDAW